jgi:hypothetical protein
MQPRIRQRLYLFIQFGMKHQAARAHHDICLADRAFHKVVKTFSKTLQELARRIAWTAEHSQNGYMLPVSAQRTQALKQVLNAKGAQNYQMRRLAGLFGRGRGQALTFKPSTDCARQYSAIAARAGALAKIDE